MNKVSISEVVDKLGVSKYTFKIYFLIGLALIFAGYNYMIVAYTMPQMSQEWALTKIQTGSLSSWSILGLLIGGLSAGVISDKIGRKKAFAIFVLVYSMLTFPVFYVQSFEAFAILRVLGGIGFGGCIPIAVTMMSESVPTKNRGYFSASIMAFYVLGWVVAGVVAIYIVPLLGWRVCYLVGGIPALYAFVLMSSLPESTHWLLGKGREKEAIEIIKRMEISSKGQASDWTSETLVAPPPPNKVGVSALFSKEFRKASITLWVIYFMGSVVIYGINGWLPTLLVGKGYGLVKGYSFAVLQNVFGMIGSFVTGYVADRIGRRTNVIFGWIFTAVAILLLGYATNQWQVVICGMLVGMAMNWGLSGTQPLLAEGYPTEFRNTGVSSAQAFGRVGGFIGPIAAGFVQQIGVGFTGIFIFFAIPAVIASFVAFYMIDETKGRSIESIGRAK
ncbi:MFS transporter [Desulfosporosinus meridiei]|uniref:Arabinose efflux permease family protein n=1 Tax=Desulfosporosinus meridiei (strain ATCC BAA-275 / DSM 13257 / KCTC 12902 / NCIMB 13706 / S10) TaxID=768704 RepID=J7IPB7_DESMD|nr:MFS transporter [Desulfosporosinus meridiei]AFQ43687.1 arabinose efflux permease family protein [Desulfosporosinus meridiei DSM 13257]